MGRKISTAAFKATLAAGAVLLVGSLAACNNDPSAQVRSTQWQVTQFSTGGTAVNGDHRSVDIPDNLTGRVFLVLGNDTIRGASGCADLQGSVTWKGDTFTTTKVTTLINEKVHCFPGDEDTAARLAEALSQQTFTWSEPAKNSLRLEASKSDESQLTTPAFVELVAATE